MIFFLQFSSKKGRIKKIKCKLGMVEHPVIQALRKLRQEDGKFKTSLSYIARLWFYMCNRMSHLFMHFAAISK
jgi:hypothetical protein